MMLLKGAKGGQIQTISHLTNKVVSQQQDDLGAILSTLQGDDRSTELSVDLDKFVHLRSQYGVLEE